MNFLLGSNDSPPVRSMHLPFNASGIAAICSRRTLQIRGKGLDPTALEGRAVARTILRHNWHTTKSVAANDGLPQPYKELHGQGNAKGVELQAIKLVLKESFDDLLDAVMTMDLIDGGISLVLRCPGYEPTTALSPENLTIDVYVSPRELVEGGKRLSERVALLVQDFGAHIALPHLHRFQNRCLTEGIKPLSAPVPGSPIIVDGPSHLPAECIAGSGYLRCRCLPAGNLAQEIAVHKLGPRQPFLFPLTKANASNTVKARARTTQAGEALQGESNIHQTFTRNRVVANLHPSNANDNFSQDFILNIGPETDAVLDHFRLSDSWVHRLRGLAQTVRSSRWEATLCSSDWGLSSEQAATLSRALLLDIQANHLSFVSPVAQARSYWRKRIMFAVIALLVAFIVCLVF